MRVVKRSYRTLLINKEIQEKAMQIFPCSMIHLDTSVASYNEDELEWFYDSFDQSAPWYAMSSEYSGEFYLLRNYRSEGYSSFIDTRCHFYSNELEAYLGYEKTSYGFRYFECVRGISLGLNEIIYGQLFKKYFNRLAEGKDV